MYPFESRLSSALGLTTEKERCSEVYLAAVSGGADSTAMLVGLAELRKEASDCKSAFILRAVHVEHGIRPPEESRGDARAVKTLCEKLDVPCRIISIPPGRIAAYASKGGPGLEGAARIFRQRALRREACRTGAERILTAHTRDDLLETLLMRILRGSGPAGLAPMSREREFAGSRGRLFRPLLDLSRQDVLAYLEEKGIPYRTDSTNADIRFLRNRIRHKLVPLLDSLFPSWRTSLPALAETQSLVAEFLASEAGKRLHWEAGTRGEDFLLRLREADFLNAPVILREQAIFTGEDSLAARRGQRSQVPRRSVVRRAAAQGAASPADLGPVRLRRQDGYIEMTPARQPRGERGFSLLIKEPGFYTLKLGKSPDLVVRSEACRDGESPSPGGAVFYARFPLVLRSHRGRDRIYRGGQKRRFSDILERDTCAGFTGIITAEDAEGPAAFITMGRDGDVKVISREVPAAGTSFFEVSPRAQVRANTGV